MRRLITGAMLTAQTIMTFAATPDETTGSSRPITSVYALEIGYARALSTYLSPLYYEGTDYSLQGSWTKDFQRWSDCCIMRFEGGIDFQNLENPVGNASMYNITGRFGWGLSWKKEFATSWRVTVGPMLDIYGGAMYIPRNGNNPVTALASAGIDAAASLSWRGRWGRLPVVVADEVRVPTIGAFFCPGYGESYYEIYLGNHRNLAHCGWWGNAFGIDNLLSLRMDLGKTGLQVGYRFDLRQFRANNLDTQLLRHAVSIAVSPNY
ncbi:MAG: DUF3316 domain-containing protein [Muribaculaceae bacterium]|nr:DUF3316 domain-containing protein [Muribaculaceae bacterium]